ncbi:protein kinase domain-containing protein [Mycolicibacterium komossense]|uniref:non-specific serine/threonine protein kinase n=1 Tax=Mycolicibacterium komossense TaxID=1779 RepID=A0ABT3CFH3_9MYCO|nr:protein kinase [Mycolicibacterium komossense]MCV7228231.1 protein kinase [Mycolicibacterium komossense]
MTGETFGRYRLEALLGEGGMGQVYRAFDVDTDRIVALKVLPPQLNHDPEFERRFRREAQIAAALNDPHIIPIHQYGEIEGRLYVDMRLVDGRDLSKVIAEDGGRLHPARTVAIVEQVATALDSAHTAGLVHRDVKPSNILIAARDFAYLIDFGIARGLTDTAMTSAGHTVGTLAYMAPERFSGIAGPESDIYSLTCVLYQCLTGRTPYAGDSAEQQLAGHLSESPPPPSWDGPHIPPAFDAVIAKGMAKNPADRYRSAAELAAASRAALGSVGPTINAQLYVPPTTGAPAKRSNAARYAVIAALALLVGGYVLVAFLTRDAWTVGGPRERTHTAFTADSADGATPTATDWSKARDVMAARITQLGGSNTAIEIGADGMAVTTSGVDKDQLEGIGAVGQFYARPVIHAIPARADPAPLPKDPTEGDTAQRIGYEKQLRQATDPAIQMLALQFEATRCEEPDDLAGHDDPNLPLVTCAQDGKSVYLLDKALIRGDQIKTARSEQVKGSDDYAVGVDFIPDVAAQWAKFTAANIGIQVAFMIDTKVATAPQIQTAVPDGRLEITGFDAQRASALAAMLAGGALPMPLSLASATTEQLPAQLWTVPRIVLLVGGIAVLLVVIGGVLVVRRF